MTTGGSSIYWDDGTCRQRIINTDDSTANTAVFNFQQSENSGSSWKNLLEIRDNGRLVLTNKTGGIYRVDDGATNEPLIHLSNNNVDSSIMRIDGNGRTSVVNTQSHGFDLKYIGTGEGENNSLDLIADNMDGANITTISVSNNGKIGIGDKFNTNYRLYVNGNSYLKGNNFLYGDLSAFYDGIDQYLQYTAEGTVASHAAKISLYRIIASGKAGAAGTKVPGVQLDAATGMLHLQAAASDPSATAGARIKFTYWNAADSNGQPVYISHSVNDSYRAPYGLKIWGSDGSAPGAWLEVEGNLYIGSASNSNSNNNAALYIRGMSAIEGYDTWLRLNDNSSFSSGTLSPKLIRSDEALQVGSGGANFYANSSGNGYIQNTFGVHGTDTTKHFFVNGTSRFADDITMDNGSEILFSTNTQYLRWTTNTGDNNSTGRSWYGIGTYQNTSDSNNSWLNISNYWGINITTKGNTCLRHNNNVITTTGNQTGTVGSGTHPIYSSGGVLMASSSTVGSGVQPIFLSSGNITASGSTVGSAINPIFMSAGKLSASTATVGSGVRGIYLNAGAITAMTYELRATINSGTANRVSFYSGSNQISSANGLYTTGGNLGINATTTTANSINHVLYVNGPSYFTNYLQTTSYFKSTMATGTAPIQVTSTTLNTNLNADLLDGYHESSFLRYRDAVSGSGGTSHSNSLWSQIGIRQYNGVLPDAMADNATYTYGAVISLPGTNSRLDIWYNHQTSTNGNGLRYRTGWDNDKRAWATILDTVNYTGALDSHYVKKSGDTMTGMLQVNNAPIFGYRYGQSNNAPAFVFDKPGSHYTGIGTNGSADTIYFGAVSTDNNWNWVTSYQQKWVFNGTVIAGSKLRLWTDSEGGNIDIIDNSSTRHYQIDAYNGSLRLYSQLCSDNSGYFGITLLDTNGYSHFNKAYGAVWNDYAEYRQTIKIISAGQCVIETGFGDLVKSTKRLQPGANIVSDTFGFAIGETEQTKTPIAVSGRVLAYPYEDRDSYQAGDPVCSGPNGTISKMTREEVRKYPDRIVGTVSEIPEYETWGTGNVKVDGRIWIKVR